MLLENWHFLTQIDRFLRNLIKLNPFFGKNWVERSKRGPLAAADAERPLRSRAGPLVLLLLAVAVAAAAAAAAAAEKVLLFICVFALV